MTSSFLNKNQISKDFKNKTFVLTGYSNGIGRRIYEDLNSLGSKIILIGILEKILKQ